MKLILTKDEALNAIYEVYKNLNEGGPISIEIEDEETLDPLSLNRLRKVVTRWISKKNHLMADIIQDLSNLTGWRPSRSKGFVDELIKEASVPF